LSDEENIRKGVLSGVLSAVFFSAMAVFVKLADQRLSSGDILFIRAFYGMVILSLFCRSHLLRVFKFSACWLWARAFFGAASVYFYYWNIRHSSLAVATLLTDLSPIFVMGISCVFLKSKLQWVALVGVAVSCLGVMYLGRVDIKDVSIQVLIFGFLSAACSAAAYVSLKQAAERFPISLILFCFSTGMATVGLLNSSSGVHLGLWAIKVPIVLLIVFSYLAQYYMTLSYKYLPATAASTLGLTACLWAYIIDLALGEAFDYKKAGILLIVLFGVKMTLPINSAQENIDSCRIDIKSRFNFLRKIFD